MRQGRQRHSPLPRGPKACSGATLNTAVPTAGPRPKVRADARGCDGGVRQELAAGIGAYFAGEVDATGRSSICTMRFGRANTNRRYPDTMDSARPSLPTSARPLPKFISDKIVDSP